MSNDPRVVVGVVGIGHVEGIVEVSSLRPISPLLLPI